MVAPHSTPPSTARIVIPPSVICVFLLILLFMQVIVSSVVVHFSLPDSVPTTSLPTHSGLPTHNYPQDPTPAHPPFFGGPAPTTPVPTPTLPPEHVSSWWPEPLSSLLRRDRALRDIGDSWFTAVFTPDYYHQAGRMRAAPVLAGCALGVVGFQMLGYPMMAAGLVLTSLTFTGQTPPNLWQAQTFNPLAHLDR